MINFRRDIPIKPEFNILLEENPKRLKKEVVKYLENNIPLEKGMIFKRVGYDSLDFRIKILELFRNEKISYKIMQKEIMRRKRIR